MKLVEGNKVLIETSYQYEVEGIVLKLETFQVILQVEHKRRPVSIEYKDIKNVTKIY